MIKQWLNLPRCFATTALHHPNVIDILSLSNLRSKMKLTFLASISTSQDPVIKEILLIFTDEEYCKNQRSKSLNNHCKSEEIEKHDKRLNMLFKVRSFKLQSTLENSNQFWKRIMHSFPTKT